MEGTDFIKGIENNTKVFNAIGKCISNCFKQCHKTWKQ